MARTLLAVSLVAVSGTLLFGCTKDFNIFNPTQGGAGGGATSSSSTGPTSSSSTGGGGAPACTTTDLSKCDDMNPCTIESCNNGACEHMNAPDGLTPGYTDDPTDCVDDTCKAGVYTHNAPDDTETPDDMNICTTDTCVGGVKTFTPDATKDGMSCGAGILKCMAGVCVGCTTGADCPGSDTFCQIRTCSAMQCGTMNQNANMNLPGAQQTANDCKVKACDANGNIVSNNDNADKPADTQCRTYTCSGGTLNTNNLASTTNCGAGPSCPTTTSQKAQDKCDGNGACVAATPMTCSGNLKCVSNMCLATCTATTDCASGVCDTNSGSANQGKCVQCAAGSVAACTGGTPECDLVAGSTKFDTCVECQAATEASDCGNPKPRCETTQGSANLDKCVECIGNGDCPVGKPTCTNNVCN